jgi:CRISPR-associated endonuclease/helicase Cas3
MTFSELINCDRRDASGNIISYCEKNVKRSAYSLENNLDWIFNGLNIKTDLNDARNEIRNIAVNKLNHYLKNNDNRVFTLTAPAGSGKTLLMFKLATEIEKIKNYEYGILYGLPYLSINDQIVNILNNKLFIETLNYTSSSDVSLKIKSMLNDENVRNDLLQHAFSENCFDHPFIVTTFNQLFETIINNGTSKLIKLKNLKKRIFLIDEFQAVNPSQYYTLVSILDEFCKKYDSYAIISTATMPCFNININSLNNVNVKQLFKSKFNVNELLPTEIFDYDVFNRYKINFMGEVNEYSLYNMILNKSINSTLLVLNTIRTSQLMFNLFKNNPNDFNKIYLLNSNISPIDRLKILKNIQNDLILNNKILVISTQVIEAGVDISFRTVFRDAAPPPSVVQANGRGNRNNEFEIIDTYLFLFKNDENTLYDCNLVYKNMTNNFKEDIKNKISPMSEKEFHKRCDKYFVGLSINAKHGEVNENQNIIDDILNGDFLSIGKYKFIQNDPNTHTVYVGKDINLWNDYKIQFNNLKLIKNYSERDFANINFKKIRGIILQNSINVRTKIFETLEVENDDVFGIFKLINEKKYDPNFGLVE